MKTKKQRDLFVALQQFYQRPVAQVSFELFLSIFAVMFFAVFAIRPTLLTMSDLIKEIKDKQKLDQQLSQKIAALSTVQPLYLQLEDQLVMLDEAIPNQPQLIPSLKIIEKIASDLQITINSINVAEIPEEKNIDPKTLVETLKRIDMPLVIAINGDYQTIRQFVQRLKDYRRTFIIDNIIFTTKDIRGTRKLEARITVDAPYLGKSQ